ncbi:MAG TPA: 50S ribosomal protein L11 methyltransferase [Terriglobales bacterium]|nr:50S ribosomal protein L11 methyltransferase [Terriglobales bacterium]
MTSSWLQLSLRTDSSALDIVSNFLIERGSPGVVIKKNEVQAYFACPEDARAIRRDVQRFLKGFRSVCPDLGVVPIRWRLLKERNWNSSWRRFFSPQEVGQAFLVAPPWGKPSRSKRRYRITIEPGMAFGTGTHATTRGCMEFIERVSRTLRGRRITALDVGTGSGILAIALAKLGAARVWALDNDPIALKVARENIHRNAVAERIRLSRSSLSRLRGSFDVVVANLTADTILSLAALLAKHVSSKRFLILSGILQPQAKGVAAAFLSEGFRLLKQKREKEWVTLLLKRT